MKEALDLNEDRTVSAEDRVTARRRLGRSATVVVASALALVVWIIAVPVGGVDLVVGAGTNSQTVGPVSVVVASLLAGGAGWALLALCEHLNAKGRKLWQWIAWGVLAISLLGPVSMGGAGTVLAILLLMHIVTGAVVIAGLRRTPAKS
jgi:hypothetical protein